MKRVRSSRVASAITHMRSGFSSTMKLRVTNSSSDRAEREYAPGRSTKEKYSSDKIK